jgi:hypothetical protein
VRINGADYLLAGEQWFASEIKALPLLHVAFHEVLRPQPQGHGFCDHQAKGRKIDPLNDSKEYDHG